MNDEEFKLLASAKGLFAHAIKVLCETQPNCSWMVIRETPSEIDIEIRWRLRK